MTRKDYILIAAALKRAQETAYTQPHAVEAGVTVAAKELADALATDNPAFDWHRFMRAAGALD